VFIVTDDEKVALPVGEYSLEDGEILKVEEEGIIASIGAAEEAPEEEVEAAEEEEMAYATKQDLAEVKEMIEEIKSMIEPKEEMSEEVSEEEVKEEVKEELNEEVELSAEEPVAKVTHNPEAETKKNLNLFAQKRNMTTADKVMQRIANIKK
jgi:hypothetical protein